MQLLVLGLGYSARYTVAALRGDLDGLTGTTRGVDRADDLRALGAAPIVYDGTGPSPALAEAIGRATHVLVSAAPDADGDPVLRHHRADLAAAVAAGTLAWIGYFSTVGVYGDTGGAVVDEATPPHPDSERTRWRVEAEADWQALGAAGGVPVALLRLAGIYGPGRNAFVNLDAGTAKRIIRPGQVFNRIHVEDIGTFTAAAARLRAGGVFNLSDDEPAPPQDPITFAAGLMGIAPPPEVPFEAAELSPMAATFWAENRRVANGRLAELGPRLTYPTYREGLRALWESGTWAGSPEDRREASPRFRRAAR
jgi:nucleoside-diphosphate-sugar epimerase